MTGNVFLNGKKKTPGYGFVVSTLTHIVANQNLFWAPIFISLMTENVPHAFTVYDMICLSNMQSFHVDPISISLHEINLSMKLTLSWTNLMVVSSCTIVTACKFVSEMT